MQSLGYVNLANIPGRPEGIWQIPPLQMLMATCLKIINVIGKVSKILMRE